jgi:POT family proton-dependent oligopeptide transporter
MDCVVFGFTLLPSQIQAVNPILIMLFIPIFSYGIYPALGKLFEVTPLKKVGIGLVLAAAAFAIVAVAQARIDGGARPHITWQLVAYIVMTAAEVMVSITALEFSYTQAPKKMKSFIMGVYLLVAIALGNLFTAQVNKYINVVKESGSTVLEGANYFWFFTFVTVVTAVGFSIWSQFYQGRTYIQGETD